MKRSSKLKKLRAPAKGDQVLLPKVRISLGKDIPYVMLR